MERKRVIIMGAAGRDFHNFNTYYRDREEYEESVRCVAAAVRDYNGGVVAGISLSGPAQRLPEERLREELIPAVLKAAQGLSRRLGYDAS